MRAPQVRSLLLVFVLAAALLGLVRPAFACAVERPACPCCPAGAQHGGHDTLFPPGIGDCVGAVACAGSAGSPAIVAAPAGVDAATLRSAATSDAPPEPVAASPPHPSATALPPRAGRADFVAATAARTYLLTARLRL